MRRPESLSLSDSTPVRTADFPQWPRSSERSEAALLAVLRSGHWWQSGGGAAERLEHALGARSGTPGGVAVSSGTAALELGLELLGVRAGDEVLVPALTFVSSAAAVWRRGAMPVPVDVEPTTLTMDAADAQSKVTERTTAIMPVHLAGQPADMTSLTSVAVDHGLGVIEDAAQAIGARWHDQPVGSLGDVGAFSFQAAKLLPAGEGGMLVARDVALLRRAEVLANCGRSRGSSSYDHQVAGTNMRMSEFNAALALAQLDDLDALAAQRECAMAMLEAALDDAWWTQQTTAGVTTHARYMVLVASADLRHDGSALAAALSREGIPSRPLFRPFHDLVAFAPDLDRYRGSCPVAEAAASNVVWLHHRVLLDGERGATDIAKALRKIRDGRV